MFIYLRNQYNIIFTVKVDNISFVGGMIAVAIPILENENSSYIVDEGNMLYIDTDVPLDKNSVFIKYREVYITEIETASNNVFDGNDVDNSYEGGVWILSQRPDRFNLYLYNDYIAFKRGVQAMCSYFGKLSSNYIYKHEFTDGMVLSKPTQVVYFPISLNRDGNPEDDDENDRDNENRIVPLRKDY